MATSDFVLVHGGFAGGWCWQRVAETMRAAGHRVHTPTLPGLAERAHELSPDLDLESHFDAVVDLVLTEDLSDFVLCGHSYGGMVITGAAERLAPRIRALVYLDGVLPEPGASLWDNLSEDQRRYFASVTEGLGVAAGRPGPGMVDPANADWVFSQSTPHPRSTFHGRVPETTHRDAIPTKVHVRAKGYPSAMIDTSHARARGWGWTCLELLLAHNVMIDAPDEVCQILLAAAG